MTFKPTDRQREAMALMSGPKRHVCLEGGSRSGKTFIATRQLGVRAIKAGGSRHGILRWKFKHVKESIGMDTFPKVMKICFPGVRYEINKSDWVAYIGTGNGTSEIWFGGLDDKERTEKILGKEFSTIYLNEASQIGFTERNMAVTRLAEQVKYELEGQSKVLKQRMLYDLNPPSKAHWAYTLFHNLQYPGDRKPLPNPEDFGYLVMNPRDNAENLSEEYLRELQALPLRLRRRFWEGLYSEIAPGALWQEETIDRWRATDGELPDLLRIVVAVDPSGASDDEAAENDEIGIVVGGLGTDGVGYVLEDLTIKTGPETWGKIVCDAYDRWDADSIVGETNFGGDMVRAVVHATDTKRRSFKKLHASRGKVARAEPVSILWHDGRMRMVGYKSDLENEMLSMTDHGYKGEGSPNRVDAMVWLGHELFPHIRRSEQKESRKTRRTRGERIPVGGSAGWMG